MEFAAPHNRARTFWLLFAALVAVAVTATTIAAPQNAAGGGPKTARPTNSAIPKGIDPAIDAGSGARVRVTLFLTDNSILSALRRERDNLTAPLPGSAAARQLAIRSPKRGLPAERVIAGRMDEQRNEALSALRRGARSGSLQSERIQRSLERMGAEVVDSSPLPNSITATVPANRVAKFAALPGVYSVRSAPAPSWHSSPVDGSETWHTNGFTGNGSSQDGLGGPDYVAMDQGVRISHQAFRTRMPGDPANGLGTGVTRIISPAGRSDFSGSQHGNVVASTVASTDLSVEATSGPPFPATWTNKKGLAYGIDKVYDTYQAQSALRWVAGLPFNSELGVADLPEVLNYSAGIYEDNVDANSGWATVEAEVSQFGTTQSVSAGNCGINPSIYTGCNGAPNDTIHRVSTPGNLYNTITVGGLTGTDPYDSGTWIPWPNSSPGPTYGGRKKPDVLATPSPGAGGPVNLNDTGYSNAGTGTSFAAPKAAAGALLLASAGVYAPTAQKAILINTATPIQSQTYWTPTAGWGALNLDGAYYNRGNYSTGSVSGAGNNAVRFFRQNGVTSGDRTTLVWNRRTNTYDALGSPAAFTLTNLDLIQVDSSTGTTTASGGVDASDTVDTNQTVSAANPIPGSGADGEDNVEQTRSTTSGTEVYKVKAQSAVDGAASEPFALAGSHPVTALQTPIPSVTLTRSPAIAGPGEPVTYTATVTNPSADLALSAASVTLNLPSGVSLSSGTATQSIGTLATNGTSVKNWTVTGATDGVKSLSADASGDTYGEPFSGNDSASFTVDGTPPTVSINAVAPYSSVADVPFSWSGSDAGTGVDHYDVELARDSGAFTPLLTATTSTNTTVSGTEGEQLHLRVRASDTAGNTSGWATHDVTIDAIPLALNVGSPTIAGGNISIPVSITNVGSPTSATFSFSIAASGLFAPLTSNVVTFTNTTTSTEFPILIISATDGLGRAASYFVKYTVPASLRNPKVKIHAAKKRGKYVTVSGSLARAARGAVEISAIRVGKTGTKSAARRAPAHSGRFSGKLKLKPGKYKLTASYPGNKEFAPSKATRSLRIK